MAKKIFITEKQLEEIVKNSEKDIYKRNSIDNIFSLPEKYKNSPLTEAYYATYPIDTVIKFLRKRYKEDVNFSKRSESNNEEVIVAIFNDSDFNEKILNKDLSLCGYYPSFNETTNGKRIITYEKRYQKSVNDIVFEKGVLYHLTRRDKLPKIMENGLCPRTEDKMFNYPERVYFFINKPSIDVCRFFVRQLARYTEDHSNDYVLLEVDIKNLGIDFFYDVNLEDAVYTKENIPPQNIKIAYNKINKFD